MLLFIEESGLFRLNYLDNYFSFFFVLVIKFRVVIIDLLVFIILGDCMFYFSIKKRKIFFGKLVKV